MRKFQKIMVMMLLAILPATSFAQSKRDVVAVESLPTNYSVETIKVGSDGTKSIKISGTGSSDVVAAFNAKRNAVHAALFKGFPATNDANETPAICLDANAMRTHKAYFDQLFAGDYQRYINVTTDGVPSGADRIKIKGGFYVKVYVQVLYDQLRQRLEQDGIIEAMSSIDIGKLPTIMVVPSDVWCVRNGFIMDFNDQGKITKVPDYARAMQENSDIRALISKMGDIMKDEGFPTTLLEDELKRLQNESVEMSLLVGSETGAGLAETPIEQLRRVAKADIILDLDFESKKVGPRTQVSFNLQAKDAYTSKLISGNPGVGSNSTAPLTVLLTETVNSFKDNFFKGLRTYYKDIEKNGREIVVVLKRFDSSPINFESEFTYNGQEAELADIIGVWFARNTVGRKYSRDERSANSLRFIQVRMPVYGKDLDDFEIELDATEFVRSLVTMLKKAPYNAEVKTYMKGLGEVWLILGEK